MSITLDDMRSGLKSVDEIGALLAATEPLSTQFVTDTSSVTFSLTPGWNEAAEDLADTDQVAVTMTIDGNEQPMTKEAAYQAAALVGLHAAYVRKTPGYLIQDNLNYHYANWGREFNALSVDGVVSAFTKPTIVPFSNVELLEAVVSGIRQKYGADTEILADYKIRHSLEHTDVRLIVPEKARTITGGGLTDVPTSESDLWSAGLHLSNSLIGKGQTKVESYLFRWWCTNGATQTLSDVGVWSRRADGQGDDVYEWARQAVDDVLGGMESRFDEVQALTSLNIAGNTADILREIFTQYEVPTSQRNEIMATLLESENLNMYAVMNAITGTANSADIRPERADALMRIGGALPTATFDTLKARVWAEGHEAEPESHNPYLIG